MDQQRKKLKIIIFYFWRSSYPVFVRLGKIKVNFNFKTIDNNELLMNSTLVKNWIILKSIQI